MNSVKVNVIEPKQKLLKAFESTDDFDLYYSQHKDEMDKMTTQKLNKCYPVTGYHICRVRNTLCLKKVIPKINNASTNASTNVSNNNELEQIKNKITAIEKYLNELSLTVQSLLDNA